MEYGGSQIMEKLMNILMEIDSSIAWDKFPAYFVPI